MKIYSQLLALCFFHANVWGTTAFSVQAGKASSAVVLKQSSETSSSETSSSLSTGTETSTGFDLFPPGTFQKWDRIEGGGTVKTYQMPPWAERCQYTLTTNGRPMKATVELWIGPIRRVHHLVTDVENTSVTTPYMATIKFRKLAPVLKICTHDSLEFPLLASVSVPSKERSEELGANFDKMWDMVTPQKINVQGGSTLGGGGSIRTWIIPDNVESVQVLAWSRDTGRKSFKVQVEVLQGPNNNKQKFDLQCGGGTQPYNCVYQTPGLGWQVRIKNKKFVEDGLVQFAVVPYDVMGDAAAVKPFDVFGDPQISKPANPNRLPANPTRQWWE